MHSKRVGVSGAYSKVRSSHETRRRQREQESAHKHPCTLMRGVQPPLTARERVDVFEVEPRPAAEARGRVLVRAAQALAGAVFEVAYLVCCVDIVRRVRAVACGAHARAARAHGAAISEADGGWLVHCARAVAYAVEPAVRSSAPAAGAAAEMPDAKQHHQCDRGLRRGRRRQPPSPARSGCQRASRRLGRSPTGLQVPRVSASGSPVVAASRTLFTTR